VKNQLLRVCDLLNLFSLFNTFTRNRATVFMMHHFCNWGERDGDSLPTDILDRCLKYLLDNNYSVIPLSEYINKLINCRHLYKTVVFTIDDGHCDFYEYAYPIFKKYRMSVAVFLVSDYIDGEITLWWDQVRYAINNIKAEEIELSVNKKKLHYSLRTNSEKSFAVDQLIEFCKTISEDQRFGLIDELKNLRTGNLVLKNHGKNRPLSWDEIIEMADNGMEFFPHTKTHPVLIQCSEEKVRNEICESKMKVEGKLARDGNIFCYPNGRFSDVNDNIIKALKEAGYIAALTAEEGFDPAHEKNDLFRLKRYSFPIDFLRFKQLISGLEVLKDALRK